MSVNPSGSVERILRSLSLKSGWTGASRSAGSRAANAASVVRLMTLPCEVQGDRVGFQGTAVSTAGTPEVPTGAATEIGVRPEFVSLSAEDGIPAVVRKAADIGRHIVVE